MTVLSTAGRVKIALATAERGMGKLEQIENAIKALSASELKKLRAWFAEFDAANWDRQLEEDVASGRLEKLAERALAEHSAGKTTPL